MLLHLDIDAPSMEANPFDGNALNSLSVDPDDQARVGKEPGFEERVLGSVPAQVQVQEHQQEEAA